MRLILAFAILLLGASNPAHEPEYLGLADDYAGPAGDIAGSALIQIETSAARADRLDIAAPQPRAVLVDILPAWDSDQQDAAPPAPVDPDADAAAAGMEPADSSNRTAEVPLVELCNALVTSAQNNDLPIPFFANLIWQESRLQADDVSKKGAQGIAQFMPQVAVEKGLADPFDPLQAIPASARFLHELRSQFSNLGFVAAAYNAGARRVAEWLKRRGNLPRETRTYVVRVTGRSVETWRSMPMDNAALTFVPSLPCRSLPAFATMEQAQLQQQQLKEAMLRVAELDEPEVDDKTAHGGAALYDNASPRRHAHPPAHERRARNRRDERNDRREARRTGHESRATKREAAHTPGTREKPKSA